jgi:tetratricopeptide (TPR) repeat protein
MSEESGPTTGLSEDANSTKTIGPSSVARLGEMEPTSAPVPRLPGAIGHYRILRVLGEGGMGTVYEAEQEQPRRVVALKVIKPGLATPERLWRFEHESQALGRLQHAGIAQIYEAGTADTGLGPQPYFAMELIRGHNLRQYAEVHHLNTRQRLELMVKICDAVHHAHQRGLIHRDLKPGNIVVDETGQPKILDFGVARVTESDAQATRQTDVGQLVGTLAYMSPEQVLADPLELDTRSDVYSLGVILYELLAERMPYNLNRRQLHQAVQAIREEDPAPLSSMSRNYRGDIETIVGRALEKDKARRYGSAAGLAADIQRYLKDEPIMARPPSVSYQIQKFARRHRALVAGVAAVFVVLVAGIVASTWEAIRANRAGLAALSERDRSVQAEERTRVERDRAAAAEQTATQERDRALSAERSATSQRNRAVAAEVQAVQERNRALKEKQRADSESATSNAVNDFLQNDLLAQASARAQARPGAKPDPDLKVRTALDRAAVRIAGKFDAQPLVEASIRQTIGRTYRDLGLYLEAQQQIQRALELRRSRLGEEDPTTLVSRADLAELYDRQGKDAEALYVTVLEVRRRTLGEEHPDTLSTIGSLASMYQRRGNHTQAEPLYIKILEVQRRTLGEEHPDTLSSMDGLATLYSNEANYAQAESLYTRVLEVRRRTLGEEHPDSLSTLNNLAELYRTQGKYAQAEPLYSKVLEIQYRVLGREHPDTLNTINNLAGLNVSLGKYEQAESLHTTALEVQRRVLGREHRDTLLSMNNLALVYYRQGKYAQAEALFAKVLEVQSRVLGEEHRDTLLSMNNLAVTYRSQRKYAEAESIYKKAVELQVRLLGEEHPDTLTSLNNLAVLYRSEGKFGDAEPLLTKVLEMRRRVLGAEHPNTLNTMNALAAVYRSQGKYVESEPLSAEVLEVRRRVLGPEHPDTMYAMAWLGEVRLQQHRYAEAEPLLREALNTLEKTTPDSWARYYSQSLLGGSLAGQERYGEAEPLVVSGYQGMVQREATILDDSRRVLEQARERIVRLYQSWGKPEQADKWRETLQKKQEP